MKISVELTIEELSIIEGWGDHCAEYSSLDEEEQKVFDHIHSKRIELEKEKNKLDYDLSTHIGRTNLYHHLLGI